MRTNGKVVGLTNYSTTAAAKRHLKRKICFGQWMESQSAGYQTTIKGAGSKEQHVLYITQICKAVLCSHTVDFFVMQNTKETQKLCLNTSCQSLKLMHNADLLSFALLIAGYSRSFSPSFPPIYGTDVYGGIFYRSFVSQRMAYDYSSPMNSQNRDGRFQNGGQHCSSLLRSQSWIPYFALPLFSIPQNVNR